MENKYGIVGVAHIGLPTNDLQKTVEFYKSLGFEVIISHSQKVQYISATKTKSEWFLPLPLCYTLGKFERYKHYIHLMAMIVHIPRIVK